MKQLKKVKKVRDMNLIFLNLAGVCMVVAIMNMGLGIFFLSLSCIFKPG